MSNEMKTRRQWLTAALRWSITTVVAGGSAVLLLRKPAPGGRADCWQTTTCRCCGQLAGCQLPPADDWKRRQGEA
jgi:hypothetical protein